MDNGNNGWTTVIIVEKLGLPIEYGDDMLIFNFITL